MGDSVLYSSVLIDIVGEPYCILIIAMAARTVHGLGDINETVEFTATAMVPDTNVDGYENTATDLMKNFLGASSYSIF